MIPIADESTRRYIPFTNYILFVLNIVVFFYQPSSETGQKIFFSTYGLIPAHILDAQDFSAYYTVFTSMFIHGGFLHLAGNLLFLWIFGDNVEYILGHFRYLVFYLFVGVGAALLQIIFFPESAIPMIGASGAISGILGAYLIKFPRNKVSILIFLVIIIRVIKVPAVLALGLWFLFQLYNAYFANTVSGGVAWLASYRGLHKWFYFH